MSPIAIQINEDFSEVQSSKKAVWDGKNIESNVYWEKIANKYTQKYICL